MLSGLILLLRRSPETEFERAMLRRKLWGMRYRLALVAIVFAGALGAAGATKVRIDQSLECLALNVYFEARGEPYEGQVAVAQVVMNRAADARFPSGVCAVIRQGGKQRIDCQFSWWCDRLSDRPTHKADWAAAQDIASDVYWGFADDPTDGALWYHAARVRAYWRGQYTRGPRIGRHIFYHDKPKALRSGA
jgi:spore germination cell wall hydrolase CwlJ-like protein